MTTKFRVPHKHYTLEELDLQPPRGMRLNSAFIEEYCKQARLGWSKSKIAQFLDIKYDTVCGYFDHGADPNAPEDSAYRIFREKALKAHRYLIDKAADVVSWDVEDEESKTSVKTAMWILERKAPEEWGPPKQRIENTTNVTHTHILQLSTRELYRAVMAEAGAGALSSGDEWEGETVEAPQFSDQDPDDGDGPDGHTPEE